MTRSKIKPLDSLNSLFFNIKLTKAFAYGNPLDIRKRPYYFNCKDSKFKICKV